MSDLREPVAMLTAGCGACTVACPEYKTCFAKADAILLLVEQDRAELLRRAEQAESDKKVAWDRMAVHNKDADDAIARAEQDRAALQQKVDDLERIQQDIIDGAMKDLGEQIVALRQDRAAQNIKIIGLEAEYRDNAAWITKAKAREAALVKALRVQLGNLGELRREIEIENRPHLLRIIDRWASAIDAALAPAAPSRERELREALGYSTPWPVDSVLTTLCAFAEMMLSERGYDGHDHEGLKAAAEAGRRIIAALGPAKVGK